MQQSLDRAAQVSTHLAKERERDKARRAQWMAERQTREKTTLSNVPCERCGSFLTLRQKRALNRFCSVVCSGAAKREASPSPRSRTPLVRNCVDCSAPVTGTGRKRCKPCSATWYERQKANERNKQRTRYHANKEELGAALWLRNHGLTLADWHAYNAAKCDLCGDPLRTGKTGDRRRLAIDHDHSHCPGGKGCIECTRGVLCIACNTAEGGVRSLVDKGLITVWGALAAYYADPPFQRWRRLRDQEAA